MRSFFGRRAALALALVVAGLPPTAPAENAPADQLARTGSLVAAFLQQFADVKCTELVTQEKLGHNGKPEYKLDSVYDLLVTASTAGDQLALEESRLAERQPVPAKPVSLLVTNGFSTLLLVFHPYYQGSFDFSRLPDEVVEGKRLLRIAFRHIPGRRTPAALVLRGREYPLDLAGTAWLDSDTGMIVKIDAEVSSMEDLGLSALRSEVSYAPMRFGGASQAWWLPVSATIDVQTARQHWRNIHRFTDYKRFSVDTEVTFPKQP